MFISSVSLSFLVLNDKKDSPRIYMTVTYYTLMLGARISRKNAHEFYLKNSIKYREMVKNHTCKSECQCPRNESICGDCLSDFEDMRCDNEYDLDCSTSLEIRKFFGCGCYGDNDFCVGIVLCDTRDSNMYVSLEEINKYSLPLRSLGIHSKAEIILVPDDCGCGS